MTLPYFSPDPVWAGELLLVGYSLFPCTTIPLHPRLTVLSGNNGVGKTTILDAVQTIILCHQQYISLNVASGQNDRSVAGQLRDRAAWAVLGLHGHETVTAMGVRLWVRAGGEQIDLTPFVLKNIPLAESLFFDPDKATIAPDLNSVAKRILTKDPSGDIDGFDRVDDYHTFLHAEGILPFQLMKKGKKKTFANLWRQITQPRLGELPKFLHQMLCPDPGKKMGFSDVEKLMQDRRSVEERLKALLRFREARTELERLRTDLDRTRRDCLGIGIGLTRDRLHSLEKQLKRTVGDREKEEIKQKDVQASLAGRQEKLTELSKQRDLWKQRQSDLDTRLRHHKSYVRAGKALDLAGEKLTEVTAGLDRVTAEIRKHEQESAERISLRTGLIAEKARLEERKETLQRQVAQWNSFYSRLKEGEQLTGLSLQSLSDLVGAWNTWEPKHREVVRLPELRHQLLTLEKRTRAHLHARGVYSELRGKHPELADTPDQNQILALSESLRTRNLELTLRCHEITRQQAADKKLRDTLAKGRPPLPEQAQTLVDSGAARPVAEAFDDLDTEQAAKWQARLGPFALGVHPAPGTLFKDRMDGPDPVFILNNEPTALEWHDPAPSGNGTVGGFGPLSWFEPAGPVWLSSRARGEQLLRLEAALADHDRALARLEMEAGQILTAEKLCNTVLNEWLPLLDSESETLEPDTRARVEKLESEKPRIEKCFRALEDLKQQRHLFDLSGSPDELSELEKKREACSSELTRLQESEVRMTAQAKAASGLRDSLLAEQAAEQKNIFVAQAERAALENEEPLEVLEGRIDFSGAEELAGQIVRIEETIGAEQRLSAAENQTLGQIRTNLANLSRQSGELEEKREKAEQEAERAEASWRAHYPDQDPWIKAGKLSEADRARHQANWEGLRRELLSSLQRVCRDHGLTASLPSDREPDGMVDEIMVMLLPPDVELDHEEERLGNLRRELTEIENRLRSYVEAIRQNVDKDISALQRRLFKVNQILSELGFGKVRRVTLKKEYLPVYEGLKKLRSSGQLPLFSPGAPVTLQEFITQIRGLISRYARGTEIEEDQISDYRTYIRLTWAIEDTEGKIRRSGFSSGEGLGINLAICLSLLFYEGSEGGGERGSGVLLMALDEAERLDERAMGTVRTLLDRVRCQMILALPRVLQVPDSVCHMLTPLKQGVTHISLYHGDRSEQ